MRTTQYAIVGGGAAGVLTATALLATPADRVTLIDPAPGRGLAYGAAEPWHLLNAPARTMSAYAAEPTHFVEWCRRDEPGTGPGDFIGRARYGDYLSEVLEVEEAAALGRLDLHRSRALGLSPHADGGFVVQTADGDLHADHVVLALGQGRARRLAAMADVAADPRYVPDPWQPAVFDAVPADRPVLVLGTGLTAIDIVLSLAARGRSAPVTALSRHGLVSAAHVHGAAEAVGDLAAPEPVPSLAALVRAVRAAADGHKDWRALVDLMRPSVDAYWRALDDAGRDRFVRHLARVWEVHRHRMAPGIAHQVEALRGDGSLRVTAARVEGARATPAGIAVRLRDRTGASGEHVFGAVLNGTGRDRLTTTDDPFVTGLLSGGLAVPGPYGMGLDVDAGGAVLDAGGRPHPSLWTVGPPRMGRLWETTAVPEIRAQAKELADRLGAGATLGV